MIAGDNLFDFSLAGFAEFRQAKGAASAVAVHDCGDVELATHYGVVERRRGRPGRLVRGEAVRAAQHAGRDRGVPLRPRARPARRALPRRRQPARPARAPDRVAVLARARVRLPLPGLLVRRRQPRPAARGRQPLARAARAPGARRVFDARADGRCIRRHKPAHLTSPAALPSWCVLLDLLLPRRCVVCCLSGAAALSRGARPRCPGSPERSASAAARPSRGRWSAAGSAPAAGSRSPPRAPRSSTTRPSALVSRLEGAGAARPRRARRRGRRRGRAAADRPADHVRAARRRPEPPPRPPSRRRGSPASSASGGSSPSSRSSRAPGRSGRSAGSRATSAGATSGGAFRARATRARRPRRRRLHDGRDGRLRPRPRCAGPAPRRVDVVTFARAVRR